jgi:hypothetical protein
VPRVGRRDGEQRRQQQQEDEQAGRRRHGPLVQAEAERGSRGKRMAADGVACGVSTRAEYFNDRNELRVIWLEAGTEHRPRPQ